MQYRKYLSVSGLAVIAVSVLLFSCLAGLMLGYIPLSFPEVLGALVGCDGAAADIVRDLRLPRIILSPPGWDLHFPVSLCRRCSEIRWQVLTLWVSLQEPHWVLLPPCFWESARLGAQVVSGWVLLQALC